MTNHPKVSFILPVLNGEALLEQCLLSIRRQCYPQEKVEIIVADGGSMDNTRKICAAYDCLIIDNRRVKGEYGHRLGFEKATGEILFIFAADNSLPGRNWIERMIHPFVFNPEICGAYTHIEPASWDNSLNRYYCLLHVEPFTWFVFGNTVQPKFFFKEYKIIRKDEHYIIFDFPLKKFPLIAFAQGFALRRDSKNQKITFGDDILPFIEMLKEGSQVAYVPSAGIHHHHLVSFKHFNDKYRRRIRNAYRHKDSGFESRKPYLSRTRRIKKYLWLVYGCTLVGPVINSINWYFRDNEKCWFWHIPISIVLSYLIIFEVIRMELGKRM